MGHFRSRNVIEILADLMARKGVPDHVRSNNGPEFTAKAIREWLGNVGAMTLYFEPDSPRENGYVESFNGKLRDELWDPGTGYAGQTSGFFSTKMNLNPSRRLSL